MYVCAYSVQSLCYAMLSMTEQTGARRVCDSVLDKNGENQSSEKLPHADVHLSLQEETIHQTAGFEIAMSPFFVNKCSFLFLWRGPTSWSRSFSSSQQSTKSTVTPYQQTITIINKTMVDLMLESQPTRSWPVTASSWSSLARWHPGRPCSERRWWGAGRWWRTSAGRWSRRGPAASRARLRQGAQTQSRSTTLYISPYS